MSFAVAMLVAARPPGPSGAALAAEVRAAQASELPAAKLAELEDALERILARPFGFLLGL